MSLSNLILKRKFSQAVSQRSEMWHQAAQKYPRWTNQVHKGESGNLDLPIHYENLRKQINPETIKNFWKNWTNKYRLTKYVYR